MNRLREWMPDAAPPPGARERVRAGVPARAARQVRQRTRLGYTGIVAAAAAAIALFAMRAPVRVERVAGPTVVVPVAVPVVVPHAPDAPAPGAALSPGLVALPSGARVDVRPGARAALVRDDASGTTFRLDAGALVAHVEPRPAERPFVVEAGEARVEVVGTVFVVERDATRAVVVTTIEGTVRVVATPGAPPVLVRAGETFPAGAPAALLPRPRGPKRSQPPAGPGSAFAAARALEEAYDLPGARRAYRTLAAGGGPEAEDALYALGRLQAERGHDTEGAAATWAEYRRRFPGGRYARAVDVQTLELAVSAADWSAVRREADAFLAAHADDARAPRFRLARAAALAHEGRCTEALADLAAAAGRPGGPLAAAVRDRCHTPRPAP